MDTPENYYAILGVPRDATSDTLKHAYRQLARRYHPDVAGIEGATEMKRINRAYAVLGDPEKRRSYDTVMGGVIDLRMGVNLHPRPHVFDPTEDVAFSGLNVFCTKGPFRAGPMLHSSFGVVSTLCSVATVQGMTIAAGSLDGKGAIWSLADDVIGTPVVFETDPTTTVESLRELRFSEAGSLLAGWGRLGFHVWDGYTGKRLWQYSLLERAVSAYYSLDTVLRVEETGQRIVRLALPLLGIDVRSPRAWGVRGTDVVTHAMDAPPQSLSDPVVCSEVDIDNRSFWAIRLRALSRDAQSLVTLSCAHVSDEEQEMAILRRWNLAARSRLGKIRTQITSSVLVGRCADSTPPYAITPDASLLAFVHAGQKLRLCDTLTGTYNELLSGAMGSSSRLALSPDGQLVAVAREDSEVNEGVIDLWSIRSGQLLQKLYHPWQVSALHFHEKQLAVGLTDGTIQIWK
ncbi:MAG TPA: hypothetical protein DHW02_01450 [Ktedonobacter sp.]|nr:hypothetical protein [Ktedonobacter sp.]